MKILWIGTIANLLMYFIGNLPINGLAAAFGAVTIIAVVNQKEKETDDE